MPFKVNLLRGEPSRIDEVMAGPWRDIRVETIGAEPLRLASVDVEYAGFVIDGVCMIAPEDGEPIELGRGGAFAIPRGGEISVSAADPCRLLLIEMALSAGGDH